MLIFIIFIALPALYLFYHLYWKRRNLPPGPMPLPYLGNLPQFMFYGFENAIEKFHVDYGDIHTVWFGDIPVISVNDFPTVEKEFIKNGDAYEGRRLNSLWLKVRGGQYGITVIDGPLWKNQRKFAHYALRDLGVGKDVMQLKIIDEITLLVKEIQEMARCNDGEVDVPKYMDRAVANIISSIVFGYRFDKVSFCFLQMF